MDALRFITCGSVDDGKSTLIGRLLLDSKAVLQDHLAGVTYSNAGAVEQIDLARLTDGLIAEREQGITIDVAYRYFSSERRKFIIGDAPGHEQYTRNMVTAASSADAAVLLVDTTKLDWQRPDLTLLAQTRRHALLCHLLRVPSLVFAVNKLDAVADAALAFAHIRAALQRFAEQAGLAVHAVLPISALKGWNVVDRGHLHEGWCGYHGPTLLEVLEQLPNTAPPPEAALAFPVQWVEKPGAADVGAGELPVASSPSGRRVFWGRVAAGRIQAGDEVQIFPSGQRARVAQVLNRCRQPQAVAAGHSAGVLLERELDVSRGDWLLASAPSTAPNEATAYPARQHLSATLAWLDDEPLQAGRLYWALHQHRWVKAKVVRVLHRLDIHTLEQVQAERLEANAIGRVELQLQAPLPSVAYARSRALGALILVDSASHRTAAAVLLD
ncbi:GTPase, sulfate adenylate transferase subunit 1 [Serpentinimonas raichei]|uniref:sulfate adenylyltransferase n=1 Tax=Serpentinimonas raichei TaxID=1458425 RepID=A0A060NIB1_9BURK|nr:GTP-binding protein [Serpentinimonas raichei]BAO81037.1 GTPase, sulfate adenylate transferase subunit 1 [Serpentinimonas raichei]